MYVIRGWLYDQALADVRSTGAGIKCLYCTSEPTNDSFVIHSQSVDVKDMHVVVIEILAIRKMGQATSHCLKIIYLP